MSIKYLIKIVMLLACSSCLLALENPISVKEATKDADEKNAKIKSYTVEWTGLSLEDGALGETKGIFSYKSPNKYRFEASEKDGSFISMKNGSKVWVFFPEDNSVYIEESDKPNNKYDMFKNLDLAGLKEGFIGREIKESVNLTDYKGKKTYLFTYEGERTLKAYIDISTGLLLMYEVIDKSGQILEKLMCDNYQIDIPLSDDLFTFKITEDMEVLRAVDPGDPPPPSKASELDKKP